MKNIENIDENKNPYDNMIDLISENMPNSQLATSKTLLNMIRDLDYGFTLNGIQTNEYGVNNVKDVVNNIINNHNISIKAKDSPELLDKEDYIEYANMKDNTK